MIDIYTEKINNAVENAKNKKSNLSDFCLSIDGMSNGNVRRLLNNLVDINDTYLEIGTWKGSTLISALYPNKCKKYFAIDNFSEHFNGGSDIKKCLFENFSTVFSDVPNFIEKDCFSFDPISMNITDVNIYFYDGKHTERCQHDALTHYYKSLADNFILIIDDWDADWVQVKQGTLRAIEELKLKVNCRVDLPHKPGQFPSKNTSINDDGWWNGIGLFSLSKQQ